MNFSYTVNGGADQALESFATTFFMIYLLVLVVWGIVSLAAYVLRAIGVYTIGRSQGDENAWLAFIPIVRRYQQGKIAGDILLKEKTIKNAGVWFVVLPIAWGILSYLASMIMGLATAGRIVRYEMMNSYGSYDMEIGELFGGMIGIFIIYGVLVFGYQILYKTLTVLIDKSIYEHYTAGNMPVIHAVLSAFVPLYEAICMFVLSRRAEKPEVQPEGFMYEEPRVQPEGFMHKEPEVRTQGFRYVEPEKKEQGFTYVEPEKKEQGFTYVEPEEKEQGFTYVEPEKKPQGFVSNPEPEKNVYYASEAEKKEEE